MTTAIKILVKFLFIAAILAVLADLFETLMGIPSSNVFDSFVTNIVNFITSVPGTIMGFFLDVTYAILNLSVAIVYELLNLPGPVPSVP